MVDRIFPLFLEVDIAVVLEDELVKLLDVSVLSLHAVVIGEGEGGLIVPVDDVHWSQGGGLDREGGSRDQALNWDSGDGEEILVRANCVTNLLRDTLANPHGHSLVLQPAFVFSKNISEFNRINRSTCKPLEGSPCTW